MCVCILRLCAREEDAERGMRIETATDSPDVFRRGINHQGLHCEALMMVSAFESGSMRAHKQGKVNIKIGWGLEAVGEHLSDLMH